MPARGEVVSLRNRTSRSFATSPGQFRIVYYSRPINYRTRGGAWRPINDRVVPSALAGYAFQNTANSYTAYFPADLGTNPILIKRASGWVSFGLIGARGPPRVSGSTVSYRDALPGVTLQYQVLADRVAERIVLKNAKAALALPLAFAVAVKTGSALVADGGGVDVVAPSKSEVFQLAPPTVSDAVGAQPSGAGVPRLALSGDKTTLHLNVDRSWLSDSARRWPVVIDPTTVTPSDTVDCGLDESSPGAGGCGSTHQLFIGFRSSDSTARRSVLHFDVSSLLPGGSYATYGLEDATLKIYCNSGTTTNSATLTVRRLTHTFATSAGWNKYDGTNLWGTPGGDFATTDYGDRSGSNCSTAGYKTWPVDGSGGASDLITYWRGHPSNEDGLLVKENPENVNNIMNFDPDTGTHPPQLVVDVYNTPNAPTTFSGVNSGWLNASSETANASGATVTETGATISKYQYETSTNNGSTWSAPIDATSAGSGHWTATITAEGTTDVCFLAVDSNGSSSACAPQLPSSLLAVQLDRTNPTAPTSVTGGSLSWQNVSSVTVTATGAGDSLDLDHYEYQTSTDGGTTWLPTTSPPHGSSATITAEGETLVRFRAVDGAANISSWYPTTSGASNTVRINRTAPTAPTVTGGSLTWQNTSSITITASGSTASNGATIDHYEYETSTDGGTTWSSVTAGSSATVTAEAETLVRFRAVDSAGIASSWAPATNGAGNTARIDRTAPTAPSLSGASGSWLLTDSVDVTASGSTDAGSGVDHYESEISTDGGTTWSSAVTGATSTVTDEGVTNVRFRAVDAAGNASSWTSGTVEIDRTPPNAPLLSGGSETWQSVSSVTVTASGSTDSLGAGFDHYQYETSTDSGDTWSSATTGSSDSISAEGETLVRFRAVDAVGNSSPWTTTSVRIDRTAPGTPTVIGGSSSAQDVPDIVISASASDSGGSGIDFYQYETSTDGGSTWSSPTTGPAADITAEGTTLVRFQATDAAGNTSGWGPTANGSDNTADIDRTGVSGSTLSGAITTNTTLTTANSPYIVTSNVTVNSGVTLTVNAGVTVKFNAGTGMTVHGTLNASGSSGSGVTFTSVEDDSDGNDSGGDGASVGTPGDWTAIGFSGSGSGGTWTYTTVKFGGAGSSPLNNMIAISDGSLSISDSTIENAKQTGLAVGSNGTATVTRTKITSNGGYGVALVNGVLTMTDSAVWRSSNNGVDVGFSTAPPTRSTITGTSIWMNSGFGVHTNLSGLGSGPTPSATGNNIYDNGSWAPGSTPLQVAIDSRSDPDWSGNYWGPVRDSICGGYHNLVFPDLNGTVNGGPVSTSGHVVGSVICNGDDVPDIPPANQELNLYFQTPPPTFGGLLLAELFGCPDCLRQYNAMIHGRTSGPNSPGSHVPDPESYTGDPVNTATGTLTETKDDIHINGPGTPFDFVRTYNSRDPSSGLLGMGWSTTYDTVLSFPDGNTVIYKAGDGQQSTFVKNISGMWVSRGIAATLAKVSDGGSAYHWTLTSTDGRVLSFNSNGQLTKIAPRFTTATTLSYNGSNQLTDITDAAGRDISLTYNGSGLLSTITLPDTRSVSYTYTANKLTGITDLRGHNWTLAYDSNGYLNSIQDPNGHYPMRATYDSLGRATSEKNANGNRTTYAYTTSGDYTVTTVHAPGRGPVVYDFIGNLLATKTDSLGNTTSYTYDSQHNVATITDPRGKTTSYTYDSSGNLIQETAPSPLNYTQKWSYDATGSVTSYTDGRGNTTNYTFATSSDTGYQVGELKTIADPDGNTTTYTYYQPGSGAKTGLAHTVQDARSKTTTYGYDSSGNETSATTPLGNETTMAYDSDGRMTSRVDPRGNVSGGTPSNYTTSWTYNDANQVTSVEDARGNTTTYTYDAAGNLQSMRTPAGLTSYGYDDANQLTSTEDPRGNTEDRTYEPGGLLASVTTPQGSKTTYGYDSAGELTSMVTPRGHESGATASDYTWTYGYDANGNRTTATHPDGGTTNITYDALNRPTEWSDALTHTVDVTYDGNGNVTRRTADLGEHWDYTYDGENRVLTASDPRAKTTVDTYWPTGQLKSKTTPAGNETTYSYDDDGRLQTMVAPRGNVSGGTPSTYTWTYGYDAAGNQTTIQDPLSNPETVKGYDADNNLTSVETPRGNTTSYTYDKMDRVATVVAPGTSSPTTKYTYDVDSNLKTVTLPKGGKTTWTYDADGNPLTKTTPVGEWQWNYFADNTTHVQTLPNTGTITNNYDRMGRTSGINYSDSTPDVSYTYDNAGRMMSMTDGQGEQDYGYDNDNRLTSVTRAAHSFSYSYSDGLNLTNETYPNGTTVTNTFTDDELLHTTAANSATTTFAYTPDDQLQTTTHPSGVGTTETRSYDADGRLTTVANTTGSGTLSQFAWTLNADGQPTQIDTTRASTTTHQALTYDSRDRLTEACYATTTCTGASNSISYSYDDNSNINQRVAAGSVPNPGTTNYTYNSSDQLTQANNGSATNYTYDTNGNLSGIGSNSFTYNLADELDSTTQGSTTATYSYDGNASRVESNTSSGPDTTFTWDTIGALPQIASEQTAAGTALRTYLYGPQGAISETTPSATTYLYRDPLGSVTDTTSSSGTDQWEFSYDPYGLPITATDHSGSAPSVPLRFTGQYLDPETAQYQMRARQYDPTGMHFDSQDPLAPPMIAPMVGAYAYAFGDPAMLSDPTGLFPDISLPSPSDVVNTISSGANTIESGASDVGNGVESGVSAVGSGLETGGQYIASGTETAASDGWQYGVDAGQYAINHPGTVAMVGGTILLGGACEVATEGACTPLLEVAAEEEFGAEACDVAGVASEEGLTSSELAAEEGLSPASQSAGRDLFHYTTRDAAESITNTGRINPSSVTGKTFLSPDEYETAAEAEAKLALPRSPEGYFRIPSERVINPSEPSAVEPRFGQPGGGTEIFTRSQINVEGLVFTHFG